MEWPLRYPDSEWLDLVADLMCAPLTCWPDERVTRLFVATFNAPAGGFYVDTGLGQVEQRTWPPEHFAPHRAEIEHWTVHGAPTQHPILRYYRATGDSCAMQVADVPSQFADRRVMAGWRELGRRWGDVPAQVAVPVSIPPNEHRAFLVGRSDPFNRREMDLARRLQRLLTGLDRQIATFSRWSRRTGSDATDVADAVRLTPRELAVLDLLSDGWTAASIGRRLHIAERTVQKHLQRCYAKLGVVDRLTAVQRAQSIGLLAPVVTRHPVGGDGRGSLLRGVRTSRHSARGPEALH